MKKLVIFDLDGTLLDTVKDLGNAVNFALTEKGYNRHPLMSYRNMVGNGVRNLIEKAQPDADDNQVDELLKLFREYYDKHCTDFTTPYKGIPELLEHLKERDIRMAVASNKYQDAVDKIISKYFPDIPFVAIEGNREGRPCKPDPSIVFSILNIYPTPKSEILYVGDSGIDMETARRACVDSVGVSWGFRPVTELRKAYADYIVSNPEEILNLLNDPFGNYQ